MLGCGHVAIVIVVVVVFIAGHGLVIVAVHHATVVLSKRWWWWWWCGDGSHCHGGGEGGCHQACVLQWGRWVVVVTAGVIVVVEVVEATQGKPRTNHRTKRL